MPGALTIVSHPVLDERLATLRDEATPHGAFRGALHAAAGILAVEATRDLPTIQREIATPLERTSARRLEAELIVVPVLRAGLAMVEGFLALLPDARVGHVGMQRDEDTLEPSGYFERLPPTVGEGIVFLLDPMLATGGSAVASLARLRANGARRLRLVCLVAAPEGVRAVNDAHPDVPIFTAALDRELDDNGYIRPGLGDAGDRVFGTTA